MVAQTTTMALGVAADHHHLWRKRDAAANKFSINSLVNKSPTNFTTKCRELLKKIIKPNQTVIRIIIFLNLRKFTLSDFIGAFFLSLCFGD